MEIILDACLAFIQRSFKRHRTLRISLFALIFMVGFILVYIEWSVAK